MSSEEFLKSLKMFNPEIAELPYELVIYHFNFKQLPEDCGKKRVLRCYNKLKIFLDTLQEEMKKDAAERNVKNSESTSSTLFQETKFLIPIYLNHMDKIPIEFLTDMIKKNQNIIKGFVLFYEDYKNLSGNKLKNYQEILKTISIKQYDSTDILIGCSSGHPSKK